MASLVLCAPPALVLRLSWMSSAPLARLVFTATALMGCWRLEAQRCRELGSSEHVLSLLWLCLLCPASWIPAGTSTPPGLLALPPLPLPFAASGTALLLLTLLNGLGPYLGYKTAATWAMFSNLHVEGGWTNHWLVPASWQLCGMAADLVTVVQSDVELIRDYHTHSCFGATFEGNDISPLQSFARRCGIRCVSHANSVLGRGGDVSVVLPFRVPFWQLRRLISLEALPTRRDFHVEYIATSEPAVPPAGGEGASGGKGPGGRRRRFEVRGGRIVGDSDRRLAAPPCWLLAKLIYFKSVLPADRDCGVCHGP